MEALFLKLVNLSLTAGYLVLAVMLARLVFRRMPKWTACVLWGLVALRLICPVSPESTLSLIPSSEPIPREFIDTPTPQIQTGIAAVNHAINPILSAAMTPAPGDSANPAQVLIFILSRVWFAGMMLMLLYAGISWLLLRRRVAAATLLQKNIKRSEQISAPFVLGLFRPVIYLPDSILKEDMPYVLAHEQAHIRRRDHWWKPMGFLLLAIYWFHPLLWAAYALLCRDIEAACDEKVVRGMQRDDMRGYCTALLNCAVRRRSMAACPLAFGETGVKNRILSVMRYRKPAFWVVVLAVAACIFLAVCFLTNPMQPARPTSWSSLEEASQNYSQQQAAMDGCVVIDGSTLIAGQRLWADFVNQTSAGRPASVRIYQAYSDPTPCYFVKDLSYDGQSYLLRFYDRTGDTGEAFLSEEKYRCLNRSIDTRNPQEFIGEYYLLADSPDASARGYFNALASSAMLPESTLYRHCAPIYCCAVDPEYARQAQYGIAFADIDGDGADEKCLLGRGQTSGVFTFTLTVYENNRLEYAPVYRTAFYALSFVQNADGALQIKGVSQGDAPKTHLFDLSVQDGAVVLLEDGAEIWPINRISN